MFLEQLLDKKQENSLNVPLTYDKNYSYQMIADGTKMFLKGEICGFLINHVQVEIKLQNLYVSFLEEKLPLHKICKKKEG